MPRKLELGDRVVITSSKYKDTFYNELGTISSIFNRSKAHTTYGVKLDNHSNPASAKGLYWFEIYNIKFENEREEFKMFNNFNVAEVEFIDNPNSGRYAYALFDKTIKVEDTVVVCTGHHGFALAKITAIHTDEESKKEVKCNREVVCRVDFSDFNNRRMAVKRISELRRDMEIRIREAQELALYEALAEKDPTLKEMLEEYKVIVEQCK